MPATNLLFPELLTEIRARKLILHINRRNRVVLWAPNTYVPMAIRGAIPAHNNQLRLMVYGSRVEVCPNPDWHRKEWYHAGEQVYICGICERLAQSVLN